MSSYSMHAIPMQESYSMIIWYSVFIPIPTDLISGESLPDRSTNWTQRIVPVVDELRRDGINIFCIGLGNALTAELNVIASDKNSVFRPADLEILVSKLNAISKQQCYNGKFANIIEL